MYLCTIIYRLLKGRSFPGKVLITRSDPADGTILASPGGSSSRSPSEINSPPSKHVHMDDNDVPSNPFHLHLP